MSNRKRIKRGQPQNPATAFIASLDGARITGGCDHCDAYQVVRAYAHGANFHQISVYHDDDCPDLVAHLAAGKNRDGQQ